MLVEREDLLLLSKLESENASLGLQLATNSNVRQQQQQRRFGSVDAVPADCDTLDFTTAIASSNSSNGDEEINFFAAVHREVVNALAEENQKLQDKVIEERIQNDELRNLVFVLKSRLALLDPTDNNALVDESITTASASEIQTTISRSKSQPCSLAEQKKLLSAADGENLQTAANATAERMPSLSSEHLNTSNLEDVDNDEQKHNYKKRMQILSHVITAMQKHYMSEIGLLRKEVHRLRTQQ